MKRLIGTSALTVAVLAAAAAQAQTSGAGAQQAPEKSGQAVSSDAHEFINKMASSGMAEVQLGKLATERAENADVKAFGQMMVKDHTQANNQLKKVASQLNVELPKALDPKHQQLHDRLAKLKGAEFDREYIQAMVAEHKQDASELRDRTRQMTSAKPADPSRPGAVGTTGDPTREQALTQWASKTLPVIEKHLERAQEIHEQLGKGGGQ
jgi:putative membrane protein